ncbi:hypothetical protein VTJ49DRAFT_380 [Mycothermus thermophilus]|uniref:Store-operated calcium entry-associated regulatory factor n=1 Tax=Humicola insolens TaxID=85995 RepID=A0ABR3VPE6_HUMIN
MRFDTSPAPTLLSLLALAALPPGTVARRPKDAILLSEVQSLTFTHPHQTTSRRVPSIPQLRCTSHPRLCALAGPLRTMRCTNQGASYTSQDIQWACTASLPASFQLDRTDVICEGYDSPDDAYVLKGSCGVEYTVRLTELGREKYPELARLEDGGGGGFGWGRREEGGGGDWAGYVFWVLFVGVVAWMVYGACVNGGGRGGQGGNNNNRRRGGTGGGGGGGGGGWGPGWGPGGGGDDNDPPPPYPGTGPGSGPKWSSSTGAQGQEGWRPGFWSGLASGAAAGYMAGSRGQRNNDTNYHRRGGSGLWGDNAGSSGWASGRPSRSDNADPGPRQGSTGYGSTLRR